MAIPLLNRRIRAGDTLWPPEGYPSPQALQGGRHDRRGDLAFVVGLCESLYCYFHPLADEGRDAVEAELGFRAPGYWLLTRRRPRLLRLVSTPRVFFEQVAGKGEGPGAATAAHLAEVTNTTPACQCSVTQATERVSGSPDVYERLVAHVARYQRQVRTGGYVALRRNATILASRNAACVTY